MIDERTVQGIITDIQRFSVHDGQGIRTVIFLKGCPLRCLWCHNPETNRSCVEMAYYRDKCIGCGQCLRVCPSGAIAEGGAVDQIRCTQCGMCADACCTRARVRIGQQKTAGELLNLVQRDNEFYRSIGGMTLSGGEPTMQPEFALALLRLAKAAGIHTAIETCGFCRWEDLEPIASACDLFLYDVKHMDSAAHKKSTGVDNRIIHENLRRLWAIKKQIIIRVPLVPGINDTAENLAATARLAEEVNAREIYILPFHQLGTEKWHALCRAYAMEETPEPTDDAVQVALEIMRAATKRIVSVGGHGM